MGESKRDKDRASHSVSRAIERGRTRDHERGLNTDSAIPGRLAFHRQSGPSTADRKVRVSPPPPHLLSSLPVFFSLPSIVFVPRQLTTDRFCLPFLSYLPLRFRSPPALYFHRFCLRPPNRLLPLSIDFSEQTPVHGFVVPRALLVDVERIESDVKGALSRSSIFPWIHEYIAISISSKSPSADNPFLSGRRSRDLANETKVAREIADRLEWLLLPEFAVRRPVREREREEERVKCYSRWYSRSKGKGPRSSLPFLFNQLG